MEFSPIEQPSSPRPQNLSRVAFILQEANKTVNLGDRTLSNYKASKTCKFDYW